MKRLVALASAALLLWGMFELWLVYPNVHRLGDPLQHLRGLGPRPAERIVYRLVEMEAAEKNPFAGEAEAVLAQHGALERNPNFSLSVSLGYPRWHSQNRRALLAPAPAEYRFTLRVPARARLVFGYGLITLGEQGSRPGAKFQVAVRERGAETVLWEQAVEPRPRGFWERSKRRMNFYYRVLRAGKRGWGDRWDEVSVSLEAYAERQVELILRTAPLREGAWPAAVFGDPVVLAAAGGEEPPAVNVVLFMVDALSRDAMGAYSPGKRLTPQMDEFARQAAKLNRYFGVGDTTRLGTFPIITGRHFAAMGLAPKMYSLPAAVRDRFYRQRFASFATVFHQAGYQTAMLGANQFMLPTHATGLDLGFDEVQDFGRKYYRSGDTLHAVMEWLGRNYTRPFFLYIHFNAPHASEKPSLVYLREALRHADGDYRARYLAYLAEVIYSDEAFGQLLQALEQLGLRERTLVILTTDHGQTLDPAHFVWTVRENQPPWRADYVHGRTLLAEEIQIPCLLDWPVGPEGAKEIDAPLASIDLLPTVAALVLPERFWPVGVDGRDFSGLLAGRSAGGREAIYTVSQVGESVVCGGRYHYLRRWPERERVLLPEDGYGRMRILSEQLYDLESDPAEHRNLAESEPRLMEEMRRLLVEQRPAEPRLTFLVCQVPPGVVQGGFEIPAPERAQMGAEISLGGKAEVKVEGPAAAPGWLRVAFRLELSAPGQGLILPYSIRDLQAAAAGEKLTVWEGPFALNLSGRGGPGQSLTGGMERGSLQNRWLRAERSPRFYGAPEGVWWFTMKSSDWIQETFTDQSLSPAVRETLQQWGYID